MNAKQALRGAAKRIENLENFNRRAAADIKAYNMVIDGMIRGESPCKWCEDYDACEDKTHGCDNWMLAFDHGQNGAMDEEGGENRMLDINTVIKGLECCLRADKEAICPRECPIHDEETPDGVLICEAVVKRDAIEYLRKYRGDADGKN